MIGPGGTDREVQNVVVLRKDEIIIDDVRIEINNTNRVVNLALDYTMIGYQFEEFVIGFSG